MSGTGLNFCTGVQELIPLHRMYLLGRTNFFQIIVLPFRASSLTVGNGTNQLVQKLSPVPDQQNKYIYIYIFTSKLQGHTNGSQFQQNVWQLLITSKITMGRNKKSCLSSEI